MTLRRRQEFVRLAREFDALIITDDVYDFLQWPDIQHESSSANNDCLQDAVLLRIVEVE
jgi:DNA-binding transcriptional MocR family regulator